MILIKRERILLDFFCKAGGAAMGYHRAGFKVVGVDIEPQPRYPFRFIQADAMDFLRFIIRSGYASQYSMFHASPPCQAYSVLKGLTTKKHAQLIEPVRELLIESGRPYVIENVPGAPLKNWVMLCGTMFGLLLLRHRLFECNPTILMSPHSCAHRRPVVPCGRRPDREQHYASVVGGFSDKEFAQQAMGIDWMTTREMAQAIPPAYTEWLGKEMIERGHV